MVNSIQLCTLHKDNCAKLNNDVKISEDLKF